MKCISSLILVLILAGCASHPPEPHAVSLCLSRNIDSATWLWRLEAANRFPNTFIFVCHGNTHDGCWYCYPDNLPPAPVETVATILSRLYPDRQIILICCNPHGHIIHVDRVWYSTHSVYVTPNRFYFLPRFDNEPMTGDIWKFVN